MARKGRIENLKPFQKGKSGNPGGVSEAVLAIRNLKRLSKESFEALLQDYLRKDFSKIKKIFESDKAPTLEKMVASIMVHAIENGCVQRMNFLLKSMGISFQDTGLDPTLNVQAAESDKPVQVAPTEQNVQVFIVEVNSNGKFVRSRPRELLVAEQAESKTINVG